MRLAPSIPLLLVALAACSSTPSPGAIGSAQVALAPSPTPPPVARAAEPAPAKDTPANDALADADRRRDPFHATVADAPPPPPPDVRPRKSRHFAVDQLTLVGVVTRTNEPRAMLMDPRGKGWIVSPGDLVGRAESVGAGPRERAASWRVDRIRESEVVLLRDEVDGACATKVLALRQEPLLSQDD